MKTKLTEILQGKNLGDDVIQAIMDDMKSNGIYLSSEENMDIRYGKLKTQNEGTTKSLEEANATIAQLQKAAKGNENLQQIIKEHEQKEAQLQAELTKAKIEAEIKVGLLAEKALDVDYLTYKLREKGELELDESGKIKGWEDKLAALKTQLPNQFETAGSKKIIENKLPDGDKDNGVTTETFAKMGYQDRLKLYKENPEAYAEMTKN